MIFLADAATPELFGQNYSYWGQFVNMLLTLGFILLLIFVSVYVLKRLMRSRIQHLNRSTGIKILERRSINSKCCLYLIDVLGKGVVIAETPAGIQVVTELHPDVKVEEKLEALNQEPSEIRDSILKKLRRFKSKNG